MQKCKTLICFSSGKRTFFSEEKVDPTAFEAEWCNFFNKECEDAFEVERGLNHCFESDIVPQASVLEAALHAARRNNALAVACRIFWFLRGKVSNESQYQEYIRYLQPTMDDLGIVTPYAFGHLDD